MFEDELLKCDVKLANPMMDCKEICNDPEKLARVGAMVQEYRAELDLVVLARIAPLREELLLRADPIDINRLRSSILELAHYGQDFNEYSNRLDAMRKQISEDKEEKATAELDAQKAQPKEDVGII